MTRRFEQLAELARHEVSGEVPAAVNAAGRERLVASLATRRGGRGRAAAPWIAGGLAAAAAIALAIGVREARAPMAWHVDGAADVSGDFVQAKGDATSVRFDNGAALALGADARGRVQTTKTGATIVLERGRAIATTPRAASHASMSWLVQAGPYALEGSGASFAVAWNDDALDVRVESGAVRVRGPQTPDGMPVHADQHLVARSGEMRLVDETASSPAPAPSPAPASTPAPDLAPAPDAPPPAPSLPWSKRVASGDYAGVLHDADARGMGTVLRSSSLADLVALADAARYGRRVDVAKRALSAQRSRFAGSAPARAAAFLLGRIAEDSDGNPAAAVSWYDRYLAEAPGGWFAPEALGRKMTAVARTQGNDAARPIADQYLRRYPDGPYASAAKRIANP